MAESSAGRVSICYSNRTAASRISRAWHPCWLYHHIPAMYLLLVSEHSSSAYQQPLTHPLALAFLETPISQFPCAGHKAVSVVVAVHHYIEIDFWHCRIVGLTFGWVGGGGGPHMRKSGKMRKAPPQNPLRFTLKYH